MPEEDDVASSKAKVSELNEKWSKRLRFAVEGKDGCYSTAWAAWEHADTVYIAGRTIGGSMKVSLHPRGNYRLAFTKEFLRTTSPGVNQPSDRCLVDWPRPDVSDGKTISLVASLFFPTQYLRAGPPPSTLAKPYLMLEAARPGYMIEVAFWLAGMPTQKVENALLDVGFTPLFRWDLTDGNHMAMAFREREFNPDILMPAGKKPTIRPFRDSSLNIGDSRGGLTALYWNSPTSEQPLQMFEAGGITITRDT